MNTRGFWAYVCSLVVAIVEGVFDREVRNGRKTPELNKRIYSFSWRSNTVWLLPNATQNNPEDVPEGLTSGADMDESG